MRYILHFNDFFFFYFCNIRLHSCLPGSIVFFRVGACIRNFLLSRESILEIIKKTVFKFGLGEHFNACNLQPSLILNLVLSLMILRNNLLKGYFCVC